MMKTNDFTLRSSYFIGENKHKWRLFLVIASLLIGIAWLPTTTVKADVVVQGVTLTDEEYSELLRDAPEGYQIVSNEDYDVLSRQRATTGFFQNAHIQSIGWQGLTRGNEQTAGTTGQSLRLEAIQLSFKNMGTTVKYQAHIQSIGWQPYVSDGVTAGTTGRGLRMEGLQIRTSGKYALRYRGHMQGYGWDRWINSIGNPDPIQSFTGTTGESRRLEAVQFVVFEKQK